MRTGKKYHVIVGLMVLAFMNAFIFAPHATAQTSATNTFTDIPVTGTIGEETFTGTLDIQSFRTGSEGLVALGRLTIPGTLSNQRVELPVTFPPSTICEILSLSLGPLDLNLLGLVIELDEVNLDITAEPGPGNLLGNLLCAVAGLLDGGFSLNLVADLLNVIVDILNDLGL
jgi:hypothetical protein